MIACNSLTMSPISVLLILTCYFGLGGKVINSVPYRPEYTVPASNPVHSTPLFRTGKNTGCTGLVPAVPANFGQYRPVQSLEKGKRVTILIP